MLARQEHKSIHRRWHLYVVTGVDGSATAEDFAEQVG
jgi:hypothetical protein